MITGSSSPVELYLGEEFAEEIFSHVTKGFCLCSSLDMWFINISQSLILI